MILTPHLLVGAAIAAKIQPLPLALILAFLNHYLIDIIPHATYSITNIEEKRWNKISFDLLKIFLDFSFGTLLIFFLAKSWLPALAGGFFAILPDGLTLFGLIFPNKFLTYIYDFHQKIHFLKNKIPFWGQIFSQIIIGTLAVFFLTN